MSTESIERAAEVINDGSLTFGTWLVAQSVARAALTAALNRDEIARALWEHDVSLTPWKYASDSERVIYLSMADAVIARILGGTDE